MNIFYYCDVGILNLYCWLSSTGWESSGVGHDMTWCSPLSEGEDYRWSSCLSQARIPNSVLSYWLVYHHSDPTETSVLWKSSGLYQFHFQSPETFLNNMKNVNGSLWNRTSSFHNRIPSWTIMTNGNHTMIIFLYVNLFLKWSLLTIRAYLPSRVKMLIKLNSTWSRNWK